MNSTKTLTKTYTFRVVVEDDSFADGTPAYHASCPALKQYGAATWGYIRDEALKNIGELVQMIVEELIEDRIAIPEGPADEVAVFPESRVAVTV